MVTVWFVPDIANCGFPEYALSNLFRWYFFSENKKGQLLTPFELFFGFMGSWSDTSPASLKEYNCKASGLAEMERFVSLSILSRFSKLLISLFGFLP